MLMMRAAVPTPKHAQHRPAPCKQLRAIRVVMMLAGCPPGVVHGCPKTHHTVGMAEKRVR